MNKPTLPGQSCQTEPLENWTAAEKWVWQQVCEDKIADFNALYKDKDIDPEHASGWADERLISPEFLETLLLHDPFQSALSRHGLRIVGAWVKEPIDLENAHITCQLWLDKSRFDGNVELSGLQSTALISLEGSVFANGLSLFATKVWELNMSGAKVTGTLDMVSLQVDGDLFMRDGAELTEVVLRRAKVGGLLDMSGAKVTGKLDMDNLQVDGDLFMRDGAEFTHQIDLVFATIGGGLNLSGSGISLLDLTGTRIKKGLRLGSGAQAKSTWQNDSRLILRNTVVNTVQDSGEENDWPKNLDLNGFNYSQLGGLYGDGSDSKDMASRKTTWFVKWLANDSSYAPQPYHHLAGVLLSMGRAESANAVLYAGKERERSEAKGLKWWGLSLLKWIIGYGYGYRYFYVLPWVVTITLIGAWVFYATPAGSSKSLPELLGFSFDLLLPFVTLDVNHKIDFGGIHRYYFYVHKLIGYILGFFIIAGLSGITKK